jgi:hypothetical protein
MDLKFLFENHKSKIVIRENVPELTDGAVKLRNLTNLDARGEGPEGRFRIGRKVCYTVDNFLKWLETRSVIIDENTTEVPGLPAKSGAESVADGNQGG